MHQQIVDDRKVTGAIVQGVMRVHKKIREAARFMGDDMNPRNDGEVGGRPSRPTRRVQFLSPVHGGAVLRQRLPDQLAAPIPSHHAPEQRVPAGHLLPRLLQDFASEGAGEAKSRENPARIAGPILVDEVGFEERERQGSHGTTIGGAMARDYS